MHVDSNSASMKNYRVRLFELPPKSGTVLPCPHFYTCSDFKSETVPPLPCLAPLPLPHLFIYYKVIRQLTPAWHLGVLKTGSGFKAVNQKVRGLALCLSLCLCLLGLRCKPNRVKLLIAYV